MFFLSCTQASTDLNYEDLDHEGMIIDTAKVAGQDDEKWTETLSEPVNPIDRNAVKPEDITIEKDLEYNKYTLKDSYSYKKLPVNSNGIK